MTAYGIYQDIVILFMLESQPLPPNLQLFFWSLSLCMNSLEIVEGTKEILYRFLGLVCGSLLTCGPTLQLPTLLVHLNFDLCLSETTTLCSGSPHLSLGNAIRKKIRINDGLIP